MKIIVIANQKGGVSKTTTSHSLGAGLGIKGFKVLLIDLDPQANLSDNAGVDTHDINSVYGVMKNRVNINDVIINKEFFDIIPASLDLASADMEFTSTGKEWLLKEKIKEIKKDYDYIIIDTPPALGILTINAFTSADQVIIPTNASIFATSGIVQLYNSIETVKKYTNPDLKIDGILFTRFNDRTIISADIEEITRIISEQIKTKVYKTKIRASIRIEEAQANRKDIFTYSPDNNVAIDYMNFIEEYLNNQEGVM